MTNILGIIPARGGSKGIPGKNLTLLANKPLIWYTIYTASKSKYLDRFAVSTEDPKIAAYCQSQNVEVIPRPAELATDEAIVIDTIFHALDYLQINHNYKPDIVVNLNPTSPLRTVDYLDKVIDKLLNNEFDSVFGAILGSEEPTVSYGRWSMLENGQIQSKYDYLNLQRRQDLKKKIILVENGSIYAIKTDSLVKYKSLIGINPSYVLMPPEESVDINNFFELEVTEIFCNEFFKDKFK